MRGSSSRLMRKPFDAVVKGLDLSKSRGDRTSIEPFLISVSVWELQPGSCWPVHFPKLPEPRSVAGRMPGASSQMVLDRSLEFHVMRTSPLSTPSAAARRSAEAQVRALIAKFAPAHSRLIGAMRRSLQKRLPTAHEVVYEYDKLGAVVISYSPSEHGYEGVLGVRADADGVRLYFNSGKHLPDPEKLLQGSANARWIAVESASTLAGPAVARLIDAAIARNRVPFARSGRGSVDIRSASAKKPRRGKK